MRSPALISIRSRTGCYAVLASLSGRYPPFEGRSPTCYSPVRHSVTPCRVTAFDLHVLGTPPALILSQDQTLMLKTLFHGSLRYRFATFNASADDLALRCFVLRVLTCLRSLARASARPLTLDGSYLLCLHALSSFQRTGLPESAASPNSGEPYKVTTDLDPRQALFVRQFEGIQQVIRLQPVKVSRPTLHLSAGTAQHPFLSVAGWRPSGEPSKITTPATGCQCRGGRGVHDQS